MNKWKATLISLLIAVIFAVACFYMPSDVNLFWSVIISMLTFLISFVFIESLEHVKKIENADTNSEYEFFKKCGISAYHNDFSQIDFNSYIAASNHIKIILLYSNHFLKIYIDALQKFVAKDGASLELVILTNNPSSNSYKYIAEKFSYTDNELKAKLDDFIKILQDDIIPYKGTNSRIELYYTDLIPAYTLCLMILRT